MDNLQGQTNNRSGKSRSKFPVAKIVFTVLGIILLAEFIYAIRVLTFSTPPPPPAKPVVVQKTAGRISLNVSQTNLKVKDSAPVSIIVDTGSRKIDGADVIIRFDPKILEATAGGIIKGRIFDEYPAVSVDSRKGLIAVSGVSSLENGFKGIGQFATINFKARTAGKTSLTVDYQKGSTTDSNLVETGTAKDILEVVDNLELDIK